MASCSGQNTGSWLPDMACGAPLRVMERVALQQGGGGVKNLPNNPTCKIEINERPDISLMISDAWTQQDEDLLWDRHWGTWDEQVLQKSIVGELHLMRVCNAIYESLYPTDLMQGSVYVDHSTAHSVQVICPDEAKTTYRTEVMGWVWSERFCSELVKLLTCDGFWEGMQANLSFLQYVLQLVLHLRCPKVHDKPSDLIFLQKSDTKKVSLPLHFNFIQRIKPAKMKVGRVGLTTRDITSIISAWDEYVLITWQNSLLKTAAKSRKEFFAAYPALKQQTIMEDSECRMYLMKKRNWIMGCRRKYLMWKKMKRFVGIPW